VFVWKQWFIYESDIYRKYVLIWLQRFIYETGIYRKYVLVRQQRFIFGASIKSQKMCWCGTSSTFKELLLSNETCVGVGAVNMSRADFISVNMY
jgi:hypothetical protein